MNAKIQFRFVRSVGCLAVLSVFGHALAEEIDVAQLTKPDSSVGLGAGIVSGNKGDRSIFGMYNGLRDNKGYGLADVSVSKRDETTGTWTTLEGRNLGLDNREFGFSQNKQGDWKYYLDYNELTRHDPRTINTALQGAGTTNPNVKLLATPGTGANLDLELKRKAFGIGGEKWIFPNLQLEVNFKTEDKNGSRLFGAGFTCTSSTAPGCLGASATRTGWAQLMLPEPVNSTTRQIETKLNYIGEKLALSGGYYGSFFTNGYGTLNPNVPGTLYNAVGTALPLNTGLQGILNNPIALPPDSQAHQLYLSGNYAFTPTTRGTFKYAYTHATQNDGFLGSGLTGAPGGRANLGGVVDTTLLHLGLTARPMPKLSLLANFRYEDKKDKTPIDWYNVEGTSTFTNGHVSNRKVGGKLEASYQMLPKTRATFGLDYLEVTRELPVKTDTIAGLSALRGQTTEFGYRAEVRQTLADSFAGTLGYINSRRRGSDWYSLCTSAACNAAGVGYGTSTSSGAIIGASATGIFPMTLTDRNRDKLRLMSDWTPTDRFSVQLMAEVGVDHYVTNGTKGLKDTGMSLFSLDANWGLTDNWKLTGYASHGTQTLHVNHSTGYLADLKSTTDTFGLGTTGMPTPRLQVGADLSLTYERDRYGQSLDPAASATNVAFLNASGGLPDVVFQVKTFKFFGRYTLDKNSDIRFNLIHQRAHLNDWTWSYNGVPFVYSDNTTVFMNQRQNVTFAGLTYIYRFQ